VRAAGKEDVERGGTHVGVRKDIPLRYAAIGLQGIEQDCGSLKTLCQKEIYNLSRRDNSSCYFKFRSSELSVAPRRKGFHHCSERYKTKGKSVVLLD